VPIDRESPALTARRDGGGVAPASPIRTLESAPPGGVSVFYRQLLPQGPEGGFNLVEPRMMIQIEEPVADGDTGKRGATIPPRSSIPIPTPGPPPAPGHSATNRLPLMFRVGIRDEI
jgi:hypothetical protein